MAVDEVFQEYCSARRIAAFDVQSVHAHPMYRLLSDHFEAQIAQIEAEFPKIPRIRFGFYESDRFGAAADIWNNTAIIRISAAVPTMLTNFFAACLSHPNSYDPPLGSSVVLHPEGIRTTDETILDDIFNQGQLIDYSALDVLRTASIVLACCGFVFLHEFIHIRNGHVDLFQSQLGLLPMEEINTATSSKLTALDLQTMEWDADNIAYILNTALALENLLGKPLSQCSADEVLIAFHIYCVSLFLLFKLMELMEPKHLGTRKHPHPVLRIMFLIEKIPRLAAPLGMDTLGEHFDVDVIGAGEATWALVLGRPSFGVEEITTLMEEHIDHGPAILKQWIELRARLTPFNRGTTDLTRFLDE
ncbi:hypothetical protein BMW22_14555 [Rhizobium leguminosarum]|uniref:Uncharacterized protein n=1 Tax=Rhizobium leguminosarum TaxID=384 RepID=A0A1L3ZAJ3_RHILE|nr:hypothetical protein [Rhizobium leguminosarum]API52675.1 hypothetical protein BMW22_14555 [Rhizobium leguminosarum]